MNDETHQIEADRIMLTALPATIVDGLAAVGAGAPQRILLLAGDGGCLSLAELGMWDERRRELTAHGHRLARRAYTLASETGGSLMGVEEFDRQMHAIRVR